MLIIGHHVEPSKHTLLPIYSYTHYIHIYIQYIHSILQLITHNHILTKKGVFLCTSDDEMLIIFLYIF